MAPFQAREGDGTGPRDLRGEDPICVLMGERERGGRMFFPLRARPITSVGSRFVPITKGLISHSFRSSGPEHCVKEVLTLADIH